jgi:hypothetical protein
MQQETLWYQELYSDYDTRMAQAFAPTWQGLYPILEDVCVKSL